MPTVKLCPLCGEQYTHDTAIDICMNCDKKIANEMYQIKASFNDSYEFILAVERWLESL